MRRALIRATLTGAAIAVWWWLVAAWVLGIAPTTPWSPELVRQFDARQLNTVMGSATTTSDGFRVDDLGPYGQALQSWRLVPPIAAADSRFLRYRVSDLPRTLEFDLVLRNDDNPGDVAIVVLPWPRHDMGVFDLAGEKAWRGKILELGFSEMPPFAELPPRTRFEPILLGDVTLESASWRGALAAFVTRWRSYQPWTLPSIDAVRVTPTVTPHQSPVLLTGLGLGGTLALLGLLGGWRGRRLVVTASVLGVSAWLVLDAAWLVQLQDRDALTVAAYAGPPESRHMAPNPDPDTQALADRLRDVLRGHPPAQHVLLWTPHDITTVRLGYQLRPLNVAALGRGTAPGAIANGTLVAVDNTNGDWHYDDARQTLSREGYVLPGDLVYHDATLLVLTIHHGAAP